MEFKYRVDEAKEALHKFTEYYSQIDLLSLSGPLINGSIKTTSVVREKWYAPIDMTKRNITLSLYVTSHSQDFGLMVIGEQDIVMFYTTFRDSTLKFNSDTEGKWEQEYLCNGQDIEEIELNKVSNFTLYIDQYHKRLLQVIVNGNECPSFVMPDMTAFNLSQNPKRGLMYFAGNRVVSLNF
ncbi:unnamed protein product [Bursaphelenchus okinawaensis]|uniref:Galectin n=1 Tax=Bursaphelenchus okinawaensis TaxID=465554 RepID=A0A811LTH2_9BILA|nr:unnamed protein product [Bursaphelenchus okinawaensis]CAG9127707.1 unnamed protein product [Bursaphelenchus okinawaensis]